MIADIHPSSTQAWRWPAATCAVVWVGALCLFETEVKAAAFQWWNNGAYTFGPLVPLAAAWMVWLRRHQLARLPPAPDRTGLAVAAAAAALWLLGSAVAIIEIRQLALVLMLQAAVVAVLGRAVWRGASVPLLYLFMAVPIGGALLPLLQDVAVHAAALLLPGLGVPVQAHGLLLVGGQMVYRVDESCAGLNFVLAGIALAVPSAAMGGHGARAHVGLLLAAIAAAVTANILRIVAIVAMAERAGDPLNLAADHGWFGWMVFATAILPLLLHAQRPASAAKRTPDRPARKPSGSLAAVAGTLALLLAAVRLAEAALVAPPALPTSWPALHAGAGWQQTPGGWRPEPVSVADGWSHAQFAKGARVVDVTVLWFAAQREGHELDRPDRLLPTAGDWLRQGSQAWQVSTPEGGRAVKAWFWLGGLRTDSLILARLFNLKSLFAANTVAALVLVSAPEAEAVNAFVDEGALALDGKEDSR